MRKTVEVGNVLEMANNLLNSNKLSQSQKDGVSLLVEGMLTDTENYNGFVYTDEQDYNKPVNNEFNRYYLPNSVVGPSVQRYDAMRHNNDGVR
jgi:hypothetical protein